MKRGWIGAGLLAVLLALGLLTACGMERLHMPMARSVERAGQYALEGNWEQAAAQTEQAQRQWQKWWGLNASLMDHQIMEQINGSFAQLKIYQQTREEVAYASACAQLSTQLEAMGDAHGIAWWSVL